MVNISLGYQAKANLERLIIKIDKSLEKYWNEEIEKNFGFEKAQRGVIKQVLLHAKEHNLRTAKRLRASFVYYGYMLGKGSKNSDNQELKKFEKEVWKVMEGVELVQTALLMHDDFMDEDKLRRGLPTTHEFFGKGDKHYGESMAVNVGDLVLCLGYERILKASLDKEKVLKAGEIMMRGIANTAFGQMYDVTLPKLGELTEDKVLAVHRAKTSIYTFQNPLIIGAVLAGLDPKVLTILEDYAYWGGVAFQLKDDLLGMFGDQKKTGKSTNSDLLQGKSTLLIAKTLELGNAFQKKLLLAAWGNKKASAGEIEKAKKAIVDSGSFEYSINKVKTMAVKAVKIADSLNNYDLNTEAVDYLKGIAEYIVEREI